MPLRGSMVKCIFMITDFPGDGPGRVVVVADTVDDARNALRTQLLRHGRVYAAENIEDCEFDKECIPQIWGPV